MKKRVQIVLIIIGALFATLIICSIVKISKNTECFGMLNSQPHYPYNGCLKICQARRDSCLRGTANMYNGTINPLVDRPTSRDKCTNMYNACVGTCQNSEWGAR